MKDQPRGVGDRCSILFPISACSNLFPPSPETMAKVTVDQV